MSFPLVPQDMTFTLAPATYDETNAFIKRPGLISYDSSRRGDTWIPTSVLGETKIMEKIHAAGQHPNIIRYYGCRVRRGLITALMLEELERTLMQWHDDEPADFKVQVAKKKKDIRGASVRCGSFAFAGAGAIII